MERYFFSQQNIFNLTKKLIIYLELDEGQINKEVIEKCKKIIINFMKAIFDKYGNKKPNNMSNEEYLDKLNKKSLSECLRTFNNKKNDNNNLPSMNSRGGNAENFNNIGNNNNNRNPMMQGNNNMMGIPDSTKPNYLRPTDIMNNFKNGVSNNQQQTQASQKEFQSYNDAGGFASFSSNSTQGGPFITATGEYGVPLELQTEAGAAKYGISGGNEGKKNFADELERRIASLRGEYGGGPMGGGNQQPQQIDEMTAKLLNLDASGAMIPPNMVLPGQQRQNNQMGGGRNNMGMNNNNMGMNNNNNNMGMNNNNMGMNNNNMGMNNNNMGMNNNNNMGMNNNNMGNGGNMGIDYSFNSGGDNLGNDINAAYGGDNGQYNGIDSFDNYFNQISNGSAGGGATTGDLSERFDKMRQERTNAIEIPRTEKFDPMKSPSQLNKQNMNGQQMNGQNMNGQQMNFSQMNNQKMNGQQMNNTVNKNNQSPNGDFFFLNDKEKKDKEVKKKKTKKKDKKIKIELDNEIKKISLEIDNLQKEIESTNKEKIKNLSKKKRGINIETFREEKVEEVDDSKKALMKLLINAKKEKNSEENILEFNVNKEENNKLVLDRKSEQNKKVLEIDSKSYTESECYNDYMITFDKFIHFRDIDIENIVLPKKNEENITSDNNQLTVVIDGEEGTFELEENYYNRDEITEHINNAFDSNDIFIRCKIEDDKFIFMSDKKFTMINDDKSILGYLGFNKSIYQNRTKYVAESTVGIGDNIFYLVIENISEEPLFVINNDLGKIHKLQNIIRNYELDHLIIKFYRTSKDLIKNNKEYSFFFERNHRIQFTLD